MTQFSLFGAAAADPAAEDLDGLVIAGGRWVRGAGGARLSVVVPDRWRADELAGVFAALGVAEPEADERIVTAAGTGGLAVRTAFSPRLEPHAARWTRGANHALPRPFVLTVTGLRLWAVAAGRRDGAAYLLATGSGGSAGATDEVVHQAAGAELSRLGVAAVSLSQRPGPGWRVTSARRLRRLHELVGPPPDGGADEWPLPTPAFPPRG
ncbi:hypothetical protein [Jatrophihabitans fulvus]